MNLLNSVSKYYSIINDQYKNPHGSISMKYKLAQKLLADALVVAETVVVRVIVVLRDIFSRQMFVKVILFFII